MSTHAHEAEIGRGDDPLPRKIKSELLKMGTRQSRLRRKDGKPPSELLGWRKRRSDDKPSSEKEKAEVEGAAHAVTKGATPSHGKLKRVT